MAGFGSLVVLFGENRADEPDDAGSVGEDPDDVGAAADLAGESLVGAVHPPGRDPEQVTGRHHAGAVALLTVRGGLAVEALHTTSSSAYSNVFTKVCGSSRSRSGDA